MSMIPYYPREGRPIVLRHRNAIVVHDPASRRLEIRGVTECPTCHQTLPGTSSSPDRPYDRGFASQHDSYVDPNYFRLLRVGAHDTTSDSIPSSPIRRILQPVLASSGIRSSSPAVVDEGAEFVSSTPGVAQAEGSRIRRNAFSPDYFRTFFVEEKVLGRGGKGVVLLVRHEIDGCFLGHFACKRVPVGDDHAWLEKVLIEVELLAKLSHFNLVSYRHVWLEDVQLNRFGPSVACAFILQQYCNGGDLQHYVLGGAPQEVTKEDLKAQMRRRSKGQADRSDGRLFSKPHLPFEEIYSLFKDITSGVAYLHASNYIHRDLKPNNCLLHRDGGRLVCLISDFGEVQPEHVVRKSTGSTGTISYCAPEVLKMDSNGQYGNFTTKSDIFSLGMILYFMCFGGLPYRSANAIQEELEDVDQLRAEITDWKGFQHEKRQRPDLPAKLYKLLQSLLSLNPGERPSAAEVLIAMQNESNFDGITSMDRNNGTSFKSRVQNLDSPVPSGTPIPDPRKQRTTRAPQQWDESAVDDADLPSSAGKEAFAWNAEDGSNLHSRPLLVSRSSRDGRPRATTNTTDQLARGSIEGSMSPPLLMAPPRNRMDAARQSFSVTLRRASGILSPGSETVSSLIRLSIFLIKLATLVRPCWPYMASPQVGVPLVILAAFDLRQSSRPRRQLVWNDRFASDNVLPNSTISLALILVHAAVLWTASRWGALCVLQPDHWVDWQTVPS